MDGGGVEGHLTRSGGRGGASSQLPTVCSSEVLVDVIRLVTSPTAGRSCCFEVCQRTRPKLSTQGRSCCGGIVAGIDVSRELRGAIAVVGLLVYMYLALQGYPRAAGRYMYSEAAI